MKNWLFPKRRKNVPNGTSETSETSELPTSASFSPEPEEISLKGICAAEEFELQMALALSASTNYTANNISFEENNINEVSIQRQIRAASPSEALSSTYYFCGT